MKKIVSLLLTAVMLIGAMSITASAVDGPTWGEGAYCVVIAASVNYRSGPGTNYDIVPGEKATWGMEFYQGWNATLGSDGKYWRPAAVDNSRWICLDYIATYNANVLDFIYGKVSGVSSNLAVRQAPTTNAPSIGSLQNNAAVTILAITHYQINGHYWYMIDYGIGTGWVASEYIEEA